MGKSLADELGELPEEEYKEVMSSFTEEELEELQYDAEFWLRPEQKVWEAEDDWSITAVVAGRGFGKTRLGTEWVRKMARENPGCRIALAGRTAGDTRRILVDGESGIIEVSPPSERPEYKQQKAALYWPNGSVADLLSSEAPDSARGPQWHFALCDEFAAWKTNVDASGATLYSNIIAAVRLGDDPKILLTTTPKRTQVMKDIYDRAKDPEERVRIISGSTLDNTSLPESFIRTMMRQYGDSDLAKQEIYGQMLTEAEGIVFTDEMILKAKAGLKLPNYPLKIIAVDPSVSADPKTSDECGIMAMGSTLERDLTKRRAIVFKDYSLRASPDVWAEQVVEAAREQGTKFVVVEKNQGGDLLRMVLQTKDPSLKIFLVTATKGKLKRAEPIIVPMQQGRIVFNEDFPELEDQLIFYDPENANYSPDRMDSFVWGATALLVEPPEGLRVPRSSSYNTGKVLIPSSTMGTGRARTTSSAKIQR